MFERNVRFVDQDTAMNNPGAEPITGDTPEEQVVSALRSVYDPEIPVNIYDLGLIYRVDIRSPAACRRRSNGPSSVFPV
jgi:hypothetical protein